MWHGTYGKVRQAAHKQLRSKAVFVIDCQRVPSAVPGSKQTDSHAVDWTDSTVAKTFKFF